MIVCATFYVLNVATPDDDDDESLKSWQKKEIKGIKKTTRVKEEKTTIEHQSDLIFTPDLHGYNIYTLKYGLVGGGKKTFIIIFLFYTERKKAKI